MSSDIFKFKRFEVRQSQTAMKVGTDGVLLGAWAVENCSSEVKNILDIGSGTGLISLIMAQMCENAAITALEIDGDAASESAYNFEKSSWSERLNVELVAVQVFAKREGREGKYDLIVTNPPYFINSLKNESQSKLVARHTELLPYDELAEAAENLLSIEGTLFVILPYEESAIFITYAALQGLYLRKRCDVFGSQGGKLKRSMMMFSREKGDTASSQIAIRKGEGFTQKYIDLTKLLYLKF